MIAEHESGLAHPGCAKMILGEALGDLSLFNPAEVNDV